jgi:hypothetical protein
MPPDLDGARRVMGKLSNTKSGDNPTLNTAFLFASEESATFPLVNEYFGPSC